MEGRESDKHVLQYVHSFHFPPLSAKVGSFFWVLLSFSSTNYIFEQCSLLFFFQSIFILGLFFFAVCAVFRYAGAFNGDLSTWQVGKVMSMKNSTYTLLPFQDWVYFWLSISFLHSVAALILFLNNALSSFFSNPFLSLYFSLLLCDAVFHGAGDFNGDLSRWAVGKVTDMHKSTYIFGCLFFSSSLCAAVH